MKTVGLGGKKAAGRVALVDDEDYELVAPYRWHVSEYVKPNGVRSGPYAATTVRLATGRQGMVTMHNLLTGRRGIDHRNHNGLDNQRANLRPATDAQNIHNHRPRTGHSSIYKGVYRTPNGTWRAQIAGGGQRRHLGTFTDEVAAGLAYDKAALELYGTYAYLNFREAADAA